MDPSWEWWIFPSKIPIEPCDFGGESQVTILASHGSHAVGACDVDQKRIGFAIKTANNLVDTLPETNSEFTTDNQWLVQMNFLLGFGLFSRVFAVSFREGI